jgi:predicted deacylase
MTVKKIMVAFLIASFLILPFLVDIKMTQAQTLVLPTSQDIIYDTSNSQWLPWIRKEDVVPDMISIANTYGGTYESIGKNMMGWDIVLFKFGNPNGGRIMIDSYLHGNEFYGYQVLRSVLLWTLNSNDADAVRIRQNNYILVIPVVNYRWARTNYNAPTWMTTQDPNGSPNDGADGLCGVNLNRNFSPSWSSSLSNSNSDSYSGTSPDSELESQALINAWNTYQPRIYWNLHQGAGPSTMCTAITNQAQTDANTARNLLPSIQNNLEISNGWSFSVRSGYGSGYSKDGAASGGIAGFLTELDPSWQATSTIRTNLESGEIYNQVKAMFISFCRATEGSNPTPTPTLTPTPTANPTPSPTPTPGPAPSATASISYSGFIQLENSAQETVFVNVNSPETALARAATKKVDQNS